MFAVTGGTWGKEGLLRLEGDPVVSSMSKKDFLIILGDCGVFVPRTALSQTVREYRSLPCSVLFLDGSRDDYDAIADQPPFPWNGGMVHMVSRGLIHLTRGQVFRLGGRTVLTMGGASTPGRTDSGKYWDWWPEQDPSSEDEETAVRNVEEAGGEVDLVLSRDCPRSWLPPASRNAGSVSSDVLESLLGRISYGRWYFGNENADADLDGVHASAVCRRVIPVA